MCRPQTSHVWCSSFSPVWTSRRAHHTPAFANLNPPMCGVQASVPFGLPGGLNLISLNRRPRVVEYILERIRLLCCRWRTPKLTEERARNVCLPPDALLLRFSHRCVFRSSWSVKHGRQRFGFLRRRASLRGALTFLRWDERTESGIGSGATAAATGPVR